MRVKIMKLLRLWSITAILCVAAFNVQALQAVYEGNLSLGKQAKVEQLKLHKQNAYQSDLLKALSSTTNEVRINSKQVLKVLASPANTLALLNKASAGSQSKMIDEALINQDIVDTNVGNIVQQFEHSHWYIYVKHENDVATLKGYDSRSQKIIDIVVMPKQYKMFTLSSTGHIFTTNGTELFHVQLFLRGDHIQVNDEWTSLALEKDVCAGNISKFSISHFGNKIALQCGS